MIEEGLQEFSIFHSPFSICMNAPFMIQRFRATQNTRPEVWAETFKALADNRGAADEVWFSTTSKRRFPSWRISVISVLQVIGARWSRTAIQKHEWQCCEEAGGSQFQHSTAQMHAKLVGCTYCCTKHLCSSRKTLECPFLACTENEWTNEREMDNR